MVEHTDLHRIHVVQSESLARRGKKEARCPEVGAFELYFLQSDIAGRSFHTNGSLELLKSADNSKNDFVAKFLQVYSF